MFIQPLPKYFGDIGERKGGNVLGLNRIPSNAAIWSAGIWIKNGTDADLAVIQAEVHAMAAELRFFAEKQDTAVEFVYLNYADPSQDACQHGVRHWQGGDDSPGVQVQDVCHALGQLQEAAVQHGADLAGGACQ